MATLVLRAHALNSSFGTEQRKFKIKIYLFYIVLMESNLQGYHTLPPELSRGD